MKSLRKLLKPVGVTLPSQRREVKWKFADQAQSLQKSIQSFSPPFMTYKQQMGGGANVFIRRDFFLKVWFQVMPSNPIMDDNDPRSRGIRIVLYKLMLDKVGVTDDRGRRRGLKGTLFRKKSKEMKRVY